MAKVLIVDDKEGNLFALEKVLERLDIEIVKALSGEDALRAALNHDFALAILDVQMPGMDGYELAALLRSDTKTRNVPLIFLSAVYSDEPYVFKGYGLGAVDFITKPFNSEILLSKVRVFLELHEQKTELISHRTSLETLVSQLQEQIKARVLTEKALQKAHDGLERRVEERTSELVAANRQLRHEIRERKRAEEALRTYTARLELANRELQEFAFVASHDLKEPLRKIQAFSDRLKSQYSASLDETARDFLTRMEGAACRMQALLEALLGYSRVATRTTPFETTDLAVLAREVVSDLELLIERRGGRVVVGEMPTVDVDPAQIRQLLQNLIANALKFNRSQEPEARVHGEPCSDGTCRIIIEDNGIGFEEKFLDRIFKPFQRLHGRSSEYEGTGMGLAICRKIVDRHGGSITARSTPGKGTAFIVTLPARQLC